MFEVLVPTHPMTPSHLGATARTEAKPMAGISGSVTFSKTATFAHLQGQAIRCDVGYIWVTLENDPEDYILFPGESLLVPTSGKVVIGGKGSYLL
jgi:Protein of unknown function (DUF2917)